MGWDRNVRSWCDSGGLAYRIANIFTIQFNAIHYFKPNNIRYVHKLEGIDPDWSTESQAQVSYTNISGGNYKFRVKAINSSGIEGRESVLDIFIEPPFWQKSWFQILFGCGLIGLVFGYIKYREIKINEKRNLEQLALQSEIKSLRSQMNPHFIFNAINTVKHKSIDGQSAASVRIFESIRFVVAQDFVPDQRTSSEC